MEVKRLQGGANGASNEGKVWNCREKDNIVSILKNSGI